MSRRVLIALGCLVGLGLGILALSLWVRVETTAALERWRAEAVWRQERDAESDAARARLAAHTALARSLAALGRAGPSGDGAAGSIEGTLGSARAGAEVRYAARVTEAKPTGEGTLEVGVKVTGWVAEGSGFGGPSERGGPRLAEASLQARLRVLEGRVEILTQE